MRSRRDTERTVDVLSYSEQAETPSDANPSGLTLLDGSSHHSTYWLALVLALTRVWTTVVRWFNSRLVSSQAMSSNRHGGNAHSHYMAPPR
jgi:hypothetical protein